MNSNNTMHISPHPLFDPEWYRRTNSDLPPQISEFWHYIEEGWRQLRSPHPLFSVEYYLGSRCDVIESGTEPLGHFITKGWKEGSNPHPLFDVVFYLSQKPLLDGADPLTHYVTLGWRKGFRPSRRFSPSWYIDQNPDVKRSEIEPLGHFLQYGLSEGRLYASDGAFGSDFLEAELLESISSSLSSDWQSGLAKRQDLEPNTMLLKHAFIDEELYVLCNPDVLDAIRSGRVESGLAHWLSVGQTEGRLENPSICRNELYADVIVRDDLDYTRIVRGFDALEYSMKYEDVRRAYGNDFEGMRQHWISNGHKERRYGPGAQLFANRNVSIADVFKKPFGINFYGPFAAISGLGAAARNLIQAVRSSGIPYELHVYDVSQGLPRITHDAAELLGTYRINLIVANADLLESVVRLYPEGHFDQHYTIALWHWELAAFRPDWFGYFGAADEIWTTSAFVYESVAAIAPVPVHKVPLPIVPLPSSLSAKTARERFDIPHGAFVFLTVFDVGSTSARKNPMAVVKAFRQAFEHNDEAFLVVKFHSQENFEPNLMRELFRSISGLGNVILISERLSEFEMTLLRAASDCLVSAHRSEGFGLNIGEFMALGKPVVATNYSGNLEFFSSDVGYPVDYRLVEIESRAGPYLPGYVWAEPDFASLVGQLKLAYEERADETRRKAAMARAEQFSPCAIGEVITSRLLTLGLDKASNVEDCEFAKFLGKSCTVSMPSIYGSLTQDIREELSKLAYKPTISIIVPVYNVPPEYLRQCVESVRSQTYPFWELCLCDDASPNQETVSTLESYRGTDARIKIRRLDSNRGISGASNAAAEFATGEFLALLDNDDTLAAHALMEIAKALNSNKLLDCIYSDENKIDEHGEIIDHFMKPNWSPEHLESVMYVLHILVVRKRIFLDLGGFRSEFDGAQDFDLMLRISRATNKIHHIQRVLYHWRAIPGSAAAVVDAKPYALMAGFRALTEHAQIKYGESTKVEPGLLPGTFRVRRPLNERIPVSLLILTNNGEIDLPNRGRIRLIDNLVDSILSKTTYHNYEVVVVDNSRLLPEQIERFSKVGVRVSNYTGQVVPFNYAAKANFSVRCAKHEHVVMLNDDMEVINEDWLTALMELAQDPDVGAVGAKLFHADGSLQHVGLVLGVNGGATHPYHGYPGDFVGYNGFTHIIRNYAAVTAACLATRKSVIAQAGGFDEKLAIDYNDVDLCLRIVDCGYRIVYTPFARLYHFESVSAKRTSQNPDEVKLFTERWSKYVENDPYYNINLSRNKHDYSLRE